MFVQFTIWLETDNPTKGEKKSLKYENFFLKNLTLSLLIKRFKKFKLFFMALQKSSTPIMA